jgi:arsenite methyltransferase
MQRLAQPNSVSLQTDPLCCPVEYHQRYLEVIPAEILERDYGCGDPSGPRA